MNAHWWEDHCGPIVEEAMRYSDDDSETTAGGYDVPQNLHGSVCHLLIEYESAPQHTRCHYRLG
jgi:hypothetical protein